MRPQYFAAECRTEPQTGGTLLFLAFAYRYFPAFAHNKSFYHIHRRQKCEHASRSMTIPNYPFRPMIMIAMSREKTDQTLSRQCACTATVINRHAPAAADNTPCTYVRSFAPPRTLQTSDFRRRGISRFPKTNPGNESPRLGGVKRLSENHQTF